MHIRTFMGSDNDMGSAIHEAEAAAQTTLDSIGTEEFISVSAQSFIDRFADGTFSGDHTCFHIITIVHE